MKVVTTIDHEISIVYTRKRGPIGDKEVRRSVGLMGILSVFGRMIWKDRKWSEMGPERC